MKLCDFLLLAVLFCATAAGAAARKPPKTADTAPLVTVDELTGGARVRATWIRSTGDSADYASWSSNSHQLAALDSHDGLGERLVLGEHSNYFKPLLTADGKKIVYSNRHTRETFVVDFDGSNRRRLSDGVAAALWSDPATGGDFVIAQADPFNPETPIVRYPMSDPVHEVFWDLTPVNIASPGSLQISRDGRRMASVFPWPRGGVAEVPNVAWRFVAKGCWPGMAPDNSYLSFVFHGNHRDLILSEPGNPDSWRVRINNLEALRDFEVYHPAWTNHPRFLTLTGPYSAGEGKARIGAGGTQVEVYLARFDPEIRRVEAWARLTDNAHADFAPNVWIEGGASAQLEGRQHGGEPLEEEQTDWTHSWPGTNKGLVFFWKNDRGVPELRAASGVRAGRVAVEPQGTARFGRRFDMEIVPGGHFFVGGLAEELPGRVRASGEFSFEGVVTPSVAGQTGDVVALVNAAGQRLFALAQDGDRFVVHLRTSTSGREAFQMQIGDALAGRPVHVLVSYAPGRLHASIDGTEAAASTLESGDLSGWSGAAGLTFGNSPPWDRQWTGRIEGIALYDRAIGPAEAEGKQNLYPMPDPAAPIPGIAAMRLSHHTPPDPDEIAPYRRALSINAFRVDPGAASPLAGTEIHVAEWSLLDGKVPVSYARARTGTTAILHLEPLDDHPQLESERLIYTGEELGREIYYSPGPPPESHATPDGA
jgi:hypothetical protein